MREEEDNLKLYAVLEVDRTATDAEIKRAYRRLALQCHPDKNPAGADRFKEITHAWEILGDERLKQIYDRYGEMGLEMSEQMGEQMANLILTPEGESMIITSMCMSGLLVLLLSLFPIFLSLRADDSVTWSYGFVFIPLWIIDCLMLLFIIGRYFYSHDQSQPHGDRGDHRGDETDSIGTNSKEKMRRMDRLFGLKRMLQFICFLLFQIFLVLQADQTVQWSWFTVFIPYFILEFVSFISNTVEFYFLHSIQRSMRSQSFNGGGSTSSLHEMTSIWSALILFFHIFKFWILRVVQSILICLQADQLITSTSWFTIFIPVYIYVSIILLSPLITYYAFMSREQRAASLPTLLGKSCLLIVCSVLLLVTVCLLAARLDTQPNPSYTLAVILIPIFIVLGLLFCCCCCCMPCMLIVNDGPPGFSSSSADDLRNSPMQNFNRRITFNVQPPTADSSSSQV